MTEKKEDERFWERRSDKRSSTLMMVFIITIITMLVVVTVMAGYGYAKYRDWTMRPEIEAAGGLFVFQDVYEDKVNITVRVDLRNNGDSETGDLELEWLIMESRGARDNLFKEEGRKSVAPIGVDETLRVEFDLRLSTGTYIIAYRTYEDGYFSYEGRQALSVLDTDVEEPAPPAEETDRGFADEIPSISFVVVVLILLSVTLLRRRKYEER